MQREFDFGYIRTLGREKWLKTAGYYAVFVVLGLMTASLGPTLNSLAEQTNSRLGQISLVFSGHGLGYLLGSLLAGRIFDRRAGHPVIAGMLAAMALLVSALPQIPVLPLLVLIVLCVGLTQGLLDVAGNTLIVWVHGRDVGPFMNGLHFFFGVGAFFSPMLVAQVIAATGNIAWAYWTLALLIVPLAVIFLRLPSPPVRTLAERSTGGHVDLVMVGLIALFMLLYSGLEVSVGGWLYNYALARGVGDVQRAAYLASAFWGALTVGRLVSIPVATRLAPRFVLGGDLAGTLVGLGVILLWPETAAALWVGTLLMGFFMASAFPTALSFAERNLNITAAVTSAFFVGASLGGMIVPWLIGQRFEVVGPQVTLSIFLVDLLLTISVFGATLLWARRD